MNRIRRAALGCFLLLVVLGLAGCPNPPTLTIDQPADGAVLTNPDVAFVISYTDADSDTLKVTLNGSDVTGSFSIGSGQATATIALANGDYDLAAEIKSGGFNQTTATAAASFTVDVAVTPYAASISIVSGDGQSGTVGEELADPLVVLVEDQFGAPFPGALVVFTPSDGHVLPGAMLTGPDGLAETALTLPTYPGGVTVTAAVDGTTLSTTFNATALTGLAANLAIYSGDFQDGLVGSPLADPLVVQATDVYGNAVAGEPIAFASADGTVDPTDTNTDGGGLAATAYTVGPNPGTQHATATAAGLTPVTFTINAGYTPRPDSIAAAVDPASVSADVGTATATATVLDQFGASLAGQAVTITSTIGVAGPVTDNGDGTYETEIVSLNLVGAGVVTAQVGALSDSTPLSVVAGAAAILDLTVPATVDAAVGQATALVTLTDAHGNGLAGVVGSITSTVGSVGAIGDLGGGSYSALITGLTTVGATAHVEAGFAGLTDTGDILITTSAVPTTLTLNCESPISPDVGLSNCTARVEDQFGAGMAGLTVGPSSACATLSSVTDEGDGDYTFTASGLTAAGTCLVAASASGLTDDFTITIEAGAAATLALTCDTSITADEGSSACTAFLADAFGNGLAGKTVTTGSTCGASFSAVADLGGGNYSFTASGLRTAGACDVTAQSGAPSDTETITIAPGATATAALTVGTPVGADVGQTTAGAHFADAWGNAKAGLSVSITATYGTVGVVSDLGGGNYQATITGLRIAGNYSATASVGGVSDTKPFTVNAGAISALALSCASPISADSGQSACSVLITDAWGNGLAGRTVTPSSGCGAGFTSVSDLGGGNYSFSATGMRTAGTCSITAASGGKSDSKTVTINAGATASVALTVGTPVSADVGQTTANVHVADAWGNAKPGLTVVITATSGSVGAVSDLGSGNYSATITGLRTAGAFSATASTGGVSDTKPFTVNPGAAAALALTCASPISADAGTSGCTNTLADAWGNAIAGATIGRSSDCGATFSAVSDLGGGNYSFSANSLRTAGTCHVTASSGAANDTETIVVNAGATALASLTVVSPISADLGATTATALFTDAYGNAKPSLTVVFTATAGTPGATENLGAGVYRSTITGLRTKGTYSCTASGDGKSDTKPFTVNPGAPSSVAVVAESPVPADGTTPSHVTATVRDAFGNTIPGRTVTIISTLGTVSSVVDAGNGNYTATVVSAAHGTATVTAATGGVSGTATIQFQCVATPNASGGTNGCPVNGQLTVKVIDDATNAPISGAFVQAGLAPDDPFVNNSGLTNGSGLITFSDPNLVGPITVTAGVPGSTIYTFLTIAEVNANSIVMPLKYQGRKNFATANVQGDVSGITTTNNDGNLDAALVLRSLTMDDLLSLNLDNLMAANVTRSVPIVGNVDVPGNIYAPSQRELIFVTISWTPYLGVVVPTGQNFDMFAITGRVPLSAVTDLLSQPDPDIAQIIPLLTFRQAGMVRNQNVGGNTTINFSMTNTVSNDAANRLATTVGNSPLNTEIYIAAVADIDGQGGNGKLVPMGIGVGTGGTPTTVNLSTIAKSGAFASYTMVAGAAAISTVDSGVSTQVRRSGLAPGGSVTLNTFFNVLANQAQIGDVFTFDDPANAVSPAMNLETSGIYLKNADTGTSVYQWDIMGDATAFQLPNLDLPAEQYPLSDPLVTPANDSLAWETSAYGLTLAPAFDFNHFAFDDVKGWITHFSYNNRTINYTAK